MKGFEYTISFGHETLYISNRPRTGFVSFIVADKQPSLLDVKERNVSARFDITDADFIKLIKRLSDKASTMEAESSPAVAAAMTREVPDEELQPKKKTVRKKV